MSDAFLNGSGMEPSHLAYLIAGLGCSVLLMWWAWMLISLYRAWTKEQVDEDVAISVIRRSIVIVLVGMWLVL